MNVQIRPMKREAAQEVFAMMRVFFDSPAVFHTSSDAVLRRNIEEAVSPSPWLEGYVFEGEGELLGYAVTAPSYSTEYGGLSIWLEDIYLKPQCRGQGLANAFLRLMEEKYPGAVRFRLEVEQENEPAIAAYKKNGYGVSPYFVMTKEMVEG